MIKYSYSFVTTWKLRCPLENAWDIIYKQEEWPNWWKGVQQVTVLEPGINDIGKKIAYTWKSALPYTLSFYMISRHIDTHHLLEGTAHGDLEGIGLWNFSEDKGITTIECSWDVNTNKKWMNMLAPLLRPLFKWNHRVVMRWGAKGLAKKLNAELLSY